MRITRHGHACLLVEAAETRVLIDPGAFCPDAPFELGELDAVVVTHQHADHVDRGRLDRLLAANPQARLLADPETCAELGGAWTPTADGMVTEIGSLSLTGVGAQHAEIVPALPRVANVGVLVSAPGEPTLFHPGDTYEYAPEGVDVLALPLAAPWGKIAETVDFARRVAPTSLLPVHDLTISELAYGIYWGHVENHAGVPDARRLGQRDDADFAV